MFVVEALEPQGSVESSEGVDFSLEELTGLLPSDD